MPSFLLIGAQKAGTTSMHAYLSHHPDIFMPDEKEPHWFVPELRRGDRDAYERLFEPGRDVRHRGEASPSYTMFPFFAGVPQRIAREIPDVRLVYLVRDPVERMRSAFIETLAVGNWRAHSYGSVREALMANFSYVVVSMYWLQLRQYLECFDPEQLLVITSEQLLADRQATLDRVLVHLGLEPGWQPPNVDEVLNQSSERRALRPGVARADRWLARRRWYSLDIRKRVRGSRLGMRSFRPEETTVDSELRAAFAEVFRDDLTGLRGFLGEDFDAWGLLPPVPVSAVSQRPVVAD